MNTLDLSDVYTAIPATCRSRIHSDRAGEVLLPGLRDHHPTTEPAERESFHLKVTLIVISLSAGVARSGKGFGQRPTPTTAACAMPRL